jgi:hypothetical protein
LKTIKLAAVRLKHLFLLSFCLSLFAVSVQAESTLDKYMKKNTEDNTSAKSQMEVAGINKVFKSTEGYWRLDDTRPTGGSCSITYVAGSYHAGFVGPSAESPDAITVFIGPSIPAAKKAIRKKMTMVSPSDGKSASVFALHGPNGQNKDSGIITFRINNIHEAMQQFTDTGEVAVVMDDKKAFSINWKGGHIARNAMQKCLLNIR